MKKLLCKIFGHKYEVNSNYLPSRCWCNRFGMKWKIKFNKGVHPSDLAEWVIDND